MTAADDLREKVALAEVLGSITLTPEIWAAPGHMDKITTVVEQIIERRMADAALAVVDTGLAEKVLALADDFHEDAEAITNTYPDALARKRVYRQVEQKVRALVREHEQGVDQ
jgi:hypothetical protein